MYYIYHVSKLRYSMYFFLITSTLSSTRERSINIWITSSGENFLSASAVAPANGADDTGRFFVMWFSKSNSRQHTINVLEHMSAIVIQKLLSCSVAKVVRQF